MLRNIERIVLDECLPLTPDVAEEIERRIGHRAAEIVVLADTYAGLPDMRPCLADEKVLAGTPRALVVRLGRGVEDDRKASVALAANRRAQYNVRRGPWSGRLAKGKVAEDVVTSTKHQSRRSKRFP